MNGTRIRYARADDAAPLAALSIEVWLSTYVKQGVTPSFAEYVLSAFTPERFATQLVAPDNIFLIAGADEGIAGYLQLRRNSPAPEGTATSELVKLYVQQRHQGSGLGRALLTAALELCPPTDRPWLMVSNENARALAFYRAGGFEWVADTLFHVSETEAYPNQILTHPGP